MAHFWQCHGWQSTWNDFELRRTFWPANHESLAGHFEISPDIYVWRKGKLSADIFNILTDRQLKYNGLLKCAARCNFSVGHFAQFPLQNFRREFTPSPDIWNFRRTCPARPADLTYSGFVKVEGHNHWNVARRFPWGGLSSLSSCCPERNWNTVGIQEPLPLIDLWSPLP